MTPLSIGPFDIICPDTNKLPRPEWLAMRRPGIGSSDAAPCLDSSPYADSYSLFCTKKGYLPDREESKSQHWGKLMEPVIMGEAITEGWVKEPVSRNLMLRSTEYPFMLANPDGLTDEAVVEIKTADKFDTKRWDEGVPDHYSIQVYHLMIVAGRRLGILPVLFGGNDLRVFEIEYEEETAERIIEGETEFWRRVKDNDPPDPSGSEASMMALRARFYEYTEAKRVELPDLFSVTFATRERALATMADAKRTVDEIKARLMEELGEADAEVGTLYGKDVCSWKADKNGKRAFRFKGE